MSRRASSLAMIASVGLGGRILVASVSAVTLSPVSLRIARCCFQASDQRSMARSMASEIARDLDDYSYSAERVKREEPFYIRTVAREKGVEPYELNL